VLAIASDPMSQVGMALPVGWDNTKPELWKIILRKGGELPG